MERAGIDLFTCLFHLVGLEFDGVLLGCGRCDSATFPVTTLSDALACRHVWRYLGESPAPESGKPSLSGIVSLEDKY
jgi:hypothetical protein